MAGKVYLVGAGPGDPELITVRGRRLLESAEVVVHDRLIDPRLLEHVSPNAELIDVGKFPGPGGTQQAEINALLLAKAGVEGKSVVRLKGGDPFVFGRGGEEAEALVEAGIPFQVVPGVTSAVAAPAYAGIPLTHRRIASSFTVVSGNEDPSKAESAIAWDQIAASGGTLVVLMGFENLPKIVDNLTGNGLPPTTPVALVRWATEPEQQTVEGDLSNIVERARESGLSPPVVAIVGDVVKLREKLRWYDKGPLFGKRVLVTRSRAQASALSQLLLEHGALPIEVPAIEVSPPQSFDDLDSALREVQTYNWVVFTSANAVKAVFERLRSLGQDARALYRVKVAAIGPATARALEEKGIHPDLVPEEYVSEALVEAFKGLGEMGEMDKRLSEVRVLLPRADAARPALPEGLKALGAQVHQVDAYITGSVKDSALLARKALTNGIDIATFASSSTVVNLLAMLDGEASLLNEATIACIGPVTADAARDLGLRVDIVARDYTIPGLVQALVDYFESEVPTHGSLP